MAALPAWTSGLWFGFSVAVALRVALIVWAEWHDANFPIPYTDVDYRVFTDAARHVWQGGSPYDRATYRYSPVLAWALVPNVWLHGTWGKWLFAAADLCIGQVVVQILRRQGNVSRRTAVWCALAFLLLPLSINLSTRGSADSIVCALVLLCVQALLRHQLTAAAAWWGIAVHVKLYPIVYIVPIAVYLWQQQRRQCEQVAMQQPQHQQVAMQQPQHQQVAVQQPQHQQVAKQQPQHQQVAKQKRHEQQQPHEVVRWLRSVAWFCTVAGAWFVALGAVCWALYGSAFVEQALLYHLTRVDTRHNFSPQFYALYLSSSPAAAASAGAALAGVAALLPQVVSTVALGVLLPPRLGLPTAMFAQTVAFVAFNKVITVQYFLWYMSLFPLVVPHLRLTWRGYAAAFLPLVAAQANWLRWAYELEFEGRDSFMQVWAGGLAFLVAHIWMLTFVMRHHAGMSMPKHVKQHRE